MSDKTKIQWTDATWNPTRGCSRVSEGCRNCYAESVAKRFSGPGMPYEGLVTLDADGKPKRQWNGAIQLVESALMQPLKWKRPRRIFVNSMSDLFHPNVPDEWIDNVFAVMALAPQHTFQILTKRPERMRAYMLQRAEEIYCDLFKSSIAHAIVQLSLQQGDRLPGNSQLVLCEDVNGWPLRNVWMGVSVEDQESANKRIEMLLVTPAAVRFISAEPLLGPINLAHLRRPLEFHSSPYGWHNWWPKRLHWVIVGGESGSGARPCNVDWVRNIVKQCAEAGVPCFVKQLGAKPYSEEKPFAVNWRFGKVGGLNLQARKGDDMDEWPVGLQVRQFPEVCA